MKPTLSIAVLGGDLRISHLANLYSISQTVHAAYFSKEANLSDRVQVHQDILPVISECHLVILPLPALGEGYILNAPYWPDPVDVRPVFAHMAPGTIVLAGKASKPLKELAGQCGLEIIDYFEREELAILNAIPTAEGAIQLAMEEMPITLHQSRCLVTGFGKTAKVLALDLKALGAHVSVAVRKYSDLAWIQALGMQGIMLGDLAGHAGQFDLVVNTVPAMILTHDILKHLKRDCLLIDLASKPGGVCFKTARDLGLKTIWALSLPGKVAPITSGEIIKNAIDNILCERGY